MDEAGGVASSAGDEVDAFAAIGLPVMRVDDDFAVGFERRVFDIYGRRLIGRYGGPAGAIELIEYEDRLAQRTGSGARGRTVGMQFAGALWTRRPGAGGR